MTGTRFFAICVLGSLALLATRHSLLAVDTGASFLKIGVGARALSRGAAFTATADDATAIFWNPAGLRQLEKREIAATHAEWIGDVRYDHLAYAHPARRGTFAGSVALLSQGSLEKRGESRQRQGSFDAQDSAVTFSMSRALSSLSSYGISVKWIEQQIDDQQASGAAVDAGLIRKAGGNARFGLAVQNAGQKLKFVEKEYRMPLSVAGGVSFRLGEGPELGVDVRRMIYEKRTSIGVGTEYWLMGRIALRGGYLSQTPGAFTSSNGSEATVSRLGQLSGLNFGFGLRIVNYRMDYAVSPSADFGNAHRLSLTFQF